MEGKGIIQELREKYEMKQSNQDQANAQAMADVAHQIQAKELHDMIRQLDHVQQATAKTLIAILATMGDKKLQSSEKIDMLRMIIDIYKVEILTEFARDLLEIPEDQLKNEIVLFDANAEQERITKTRTLQNMTRMLK